MNRCDSLQLIEQIYTYVGQEEFTKHNVPLEFRNQLARLSTNGYLRRTHKIKDDHDHGRLIPVYRIVSRYYPRSCVPPLSAIKENHDTVALIKE